MIDPDVAALMESGVSTMIGSVDADGNPAGMHAMGVKVLDGGARLRVVLNAEETGILDNLRSTGVVALSVTEVPTLRSVQAKGRAEKVEPVTAEDRIRTDRYLAEFFQSVNETDGTPIELLQRLVARELVAMEMTVEELYDQTPGPQAGARLAAS